MIEKGIPIPEPFGRTEAGNEARQMKPGDSRMCLTEAERDTTRYMIKRRGGKATVRKVDGGWRVWRTA